MINEPERTELPQQEQEEIPAETSKPEASLGAAFAGRSPDLIESQALFMANLTAGVLFSGEPEKAASFVEKVSPINAAIDSGEVLDNLHNLSLGWRLFIGCMGCLFMAAAVDPSRYGVGAVVARVKQIKRGGEDNATPGNHVAERGSAEAPGEESALPGGGEDGVRRRHDL